MRTLFNSFHEHYPNPHPGRNGLISDGVRGATGEPEALGDIRRDSGIDGDIEGAERPTDELGTDTRRHDLTGELRHGGDSELRDAVTQQRLDASAANLKSCMERVISSLSVLGNDELVQDSGIVESTREVVEALEPIVSSFEAQRATPPKHDLTSAMARVINGLTAMDSEDVFGESEIIAEIKSLVERVEAHTIAQEQLTQHTNLGDHHVGQNSSRESTRTTVRRDAGIDTHARNTRIEPDGTNSRTERHSADFGKIDGASIDNRVLERGDSGLPRADFDRSRTSDQQAERGREQDARRDWKPIGIDRSTEHTGRKELGNPEVSYGLTDGEQPEARHTVAERLLEHAYRERLSRELSDPLARLVSTLAELRKVEELNLSLQAEIEQRTQRVLSQAKVEILDTTLTQWRSLTQEPELLQIPELAQNSTEELTPAEVAELTSLIANYPAQKVIEYAMAEYYQATEQVIETKSTLKAETPDFSVEQQSNRESKLYDTLDRVPKPRTNSPPKPNQSAAPGRTIPPAKPKPRPQRPLTPRPEKRVPVVAFWQPDYVEARRPDLLEPEHWEEFKRSAIHPDLVQLNVSSLEGQPVLERLLDEKLGSLSGDANQYATEEVKRIIKPYERVAEGGWWGTAGVDAKSLIDLQPGEKPQQSLWGVFKPDKPILEVKKPLIRHRYGEVDKAEKIQRQNTESLSIALLMAAGINANKFIEYRARKYENPAGTERHLYLPNVPKEIAQRIYAKHDIQPTEAEQQSGFWSVVVSYPELPIVVTEGFKKTLSSLSQGEVTIGLAGVNALYRARDDDKEKLPERVLNDEVAIFATPGRSFTFAYDSDSKTSTVFNVRAELVRGVELLEARGSDVKVAQWKPELGKGLDDLITDQGPTAYAVALAKAEAAEREKRLYYRTQYNALAREVRKQKPGISGEALDIEVYLLAITKGELKDGKRFLSQSDQARSLKDPAQVTAYIEHIKASLPQYLQQQREIERTQAAAAVQRQQELDAAKAVAHAAAQRQKELAAAQVTDRAEYLAIAQPIKDRLGELPAERLDMEVCLSLQASGKDVSRILAQSDQALTMHDPQQVEDYVDLIQTAVPAYQQEQDQMAQLEIDRALYDAIALKVKAEISNDIESDHLDMEVCLRVQSSGGDVERILAQSLEVRRVKSPFHVQEYIDNIKAAAPEYKRQKEADIEALEQQDRDRAEYLSIVKFARRTMGDFPEDQLDLYVCLSVGIDGKEAERVLAQSDKALELKLPKKVKAYIDKVNAQIKDYPIQQKAIQVEVDRKAYEALAQPLRLGLGHIDAGRLDALIYRAAVESGKYTPERIEDIISQSKYSRALKTADELRDHLKGVEQSANHPEFGNFRSSKKTSAIKAEQDARNLQALEPSKWLARNKGEPQKDGSYLYEIYAYTFWLKGNHLKVIRKGDETVLESNGIAVNGRVTHQELDVFQKSVQSEKQAKVQEKQKQKQKTYEPPSQDFGFER